ncbi:hypothetical protein GN956_G23131 [Arapaima gigas]
MVGGTNTPQVVMAACRIGLLRAALNGGKTLRTNYAPVSAARPANFSFPVGTETGRTSAPRDTARGGAQTCGERGWSPFELGAQHALGFDRSPEPESCACHSTHENQQKKRPTFPPCDCQTLLFPPEAAHSALHHRGHNF